MSNPNIPVDKQTNAVQIIGLIGGVIAAMLVYYIMPSNAGEIALAAANGKTLNVNALPIVAAVAVLMGIWWMTEAIALPATALLPMVLFPILGVDTFKNAAAPYASDTHGWFRFSPCYAKMESPYSYCSWHCTFSRY